MMTSEIGTPVRLRVWKKCFSWRIVLTRILVRGMSVRSSLCGLRFESCGPRLIRTFPVGIPVRLMVCVRMFSQAAAFNQNMSAWDVAAVTTFQSMWTLSTAMLGANGDANRLAIHTAWNGNANWTYQWGS